ncbi:MAG: cytochrome c maturation protein CcmE [candidate division WOR-3 bacterium]|nr:cytochrome c maturation protein CcmE [candidate division WOR-3 bacterium]MCX7947633.1 cytochrome c maturation protein CcmE [candidate division WOR-3 bacterium]MDW8150511.1 cytochrome c maturation protein CcmE [candidate division WOR-3 bacterium]
MKRLKYIFLILALLVSIIYAVYAGINNSAVYYYTVEELYKKPIKSKNVKVSGIVKRNSVIKQMNEVQFTIYQNDKQVKVVYNGILPDAFSEENEVIAEGEYDRNNNTIYARNLLTKCPSRYEKLNN